MKQPAPPLQISFESPRPNTLPGGHTRFAGTFRARETEAAGAISFVLNGNRVEPTRHNLRILVRGDCLHWDFEHDLDDTVWNARGVVTLDILDRGLVVGSRSWRIDRGLLPHQPPLSLFLHVPKCGGSSIRVQLESLRNDLAFQVLYPERPYEGVPGTVAEAIPPNCELVFGHFLFGLHRLVERPCRYATILRDPVDLALSQYFCAKIVLARPKAVACNSIFEALVAIPGTFDNLLTRWLSGIRYPLPLDASAVDRACHHLKTHFDVIGFVDTMDETCGTLARYFGLPIVSRCSNATPESAERAAVDRQVFTRAAERLLRWDLQLYERAKEIAATLPRP